MSHAGFPATAGTSRAVLVTGCSSGIGRATALRLARRGWPVYATARKRDSLGELEEAGCRTLVLDVDDEESCRSAVAFVEEREGAVGVLVNNAGYSQSGAVEAVPLDLVRKQFETNVFGALRMCQLVLPGMRRQGWGKIVNMSSMGGKLVFPGGGVYHATKHALEALSDALRFEVRAFGIDVILMEPGLVRSGFARAAERALEAARAGAGPYADFHAAVARATVEAYEKGPLARLGGTPEDVAAKVEKAITARRPKARYTVTASATVLLGLRRMLGDRMWDAFLRTNFPEPGGRKSS
ncbi:MAG: short-chain dehydrogenase/reductase [Candidatus Binatia bacterium]|nr:MAG: short-chain dehydrogenase/reductase [Candidatus Binatia bacterium]